MPDKASRDEIGLQSLELLAAGYHAETWKKEQKNERKREREREGERKRKERNKLMLGEKVTLILSEN